MMIKKPFGKKVITLILVIVLTVTPFSYVKADTYTVDDVYLKLRDILYVLNGYGQNIPTAGIDDQIQDLQDLFDSIFVDSSYNYQGLTGLVQNQTFMQLMQVIADQGYTIPSRLMEGYFVRDSSGNLVHMAGISESLAQIEFEFNQLNINSSTVVSQLRTLITHIGNILLTLNSVSTTLNNILQTDNNIYNLETNFYNYIQNGSFKADLDNVIDTISWKSFNVSSIVGIGGSGSFGNYYSNSFIQISFGSAPNSILQNNIPVIFKIRVNCITSNFNQWNDSNFRLVINSTSNPGDYYKCKYYVNNFGNYSDLYIYDISNFPLNAYIRLYFVDNTYYGSAVTSVSYLPAIDIEYWELKSYFDLHQFLLDYESVNSSELDQLKQQNQQFNNTLQNFNNLENQISTDFSNNLVTFNSNLTESQTLMSSLTTAVVWFSQQMDNVFNVSGSFKMLFILPMILGIALWFIGRGSFVLRSAGRRSEKKKE